MKLKLYQKNLTFVYLAFAALLLVATSLTSCKKKTEVTGTFYLAFVNAGETSSPIDFYVDNNKVNAAALSYNQNISYFSLSSTDHTALIKTSASGVVLTSFNLSPQAGTYYSIFYVDGTTIAYNDDPTPPQSGKARVRFINLNLGMTGNLDIGITGGSVLAASLPNALNSSYYEVAPGSSFSFYATGTTTSLLTLSTTIQAGHIYTIYLSGAAQASVVGTALLQK